MERKQIMKIGIVGSGKIVVEFLPVAREIKDIEIEAICGRKSSLKKLEQLQETYHIGKYSILIRRC